MARSKNKIKNSHFYFSGKSKLDGPRKWTIWEKGLKKYSISRICRFFEVVDLPNSLIYRIRRFSEFVDLPNSSIFQIRRYPEFVDLPNFSKKRLLSAPERDSSDSFSDWASVI